MTLFLLVGLLGVAFLAGAAVGALIAREFRIYREVNAYGGELDFTGSSGRRAER